MKKASNVAPQKKTSTSNEEINFKETSYGKQSEACMKNWKN